MAKKEFTVKQGLAVQAKNMAFWKKVLKKKHYQTLVEMVDYANVNNRYRDGYDVMRGSDISSALQNLDWTRVELGLSPGSKCKPFVEDSLSSLARSED